MARWSGVFVALALVLCLPAAARAQAALTGVVHDATGAVLPGVTVEAASPALIEKVRTTVSDSSGRYQIIQLRPGAYTVTFTLAGFNTIRRDGITLSGSSTSSVDVEMRVGAIEETVTVTGQAPTVDVSTTTRQTVLSTDTIDALPTSRNAYSLTRLIPAAIQSSNGGGNDTSVDSGTAVLQMVGGSVRIHGSRAQDQRITLNGVRATALEIGGNGSAQPPDMGSVTEVAVDSSSLSAEEGTGGVRINMIPRDGGNRFADSTFFSFANAALQGSNFTDDLRRAGLASPGGLKLVTDLNPAAGGPIKRDKVWFWVSTRFVSQDTYVTVFDNKNAYKPNEWLYVPDTSKDPSFMKGRQYGASLRLTWQATPRNKFAGTYKYDEWCQCPSQVNATRSPDAAVDFNFPRLAQEHGEWTSPVTNRLLLEGVFVHVYEGWENAPQERSGGTREEIGLALASQMIPVTEQSTGMNYRAPSGGNRVTRGPSFSYRGTLSYVTGTHSLKTGFLNTPGSNWNSTYASQDLAYRFNNGIPNQLTMRGWPISREIDQAADLGFYLQDRWRRNRMTINGALRYDIFKSGFPEQHVGPSRLTPARDVTFPKQDNLDWTDFTYRSGLAYDVRGDGRTALKFAFNKYVMGQGTNAIAGDPNPVNTMVATATRAWTDANRDYVPDCDLLNFNANGECAAISDRNFGSGVPGALFDPKLITGFGHRPQNWEFSAGVQHEILPRVAVDVGYFRRVWKNFRVTDNLAVSAADYSTFSMVVPSDPRLPGGGGNTLTGLYTLKPEAFGRPTQNLNTLDRDFGQQLEHWNGVDVAVEARLPRGVTFQAGTSTGRTSENDCDILSKLPEMTVVTSGLRPAGFCDRKTPWLTAFKAYAVYTVPRIVVQVAGTLVSQPGLPVTATFNATNAYLAANSTLTTPLAGGAANVAIDLLEPNTVYLDRRNEINLRVGKVLRMGRARTVASVDVFNLLNINTVTTANFNFGSFLQPTAIVPPRLFKFSLQFDF